ncbi:MAG: HD domain-containing protein [Desulfocapsaceae bacterium]|nr:HD domain-containing protein [Desulfocapsaceae bacterium]
MIDNIHKWLILRLTLVWLVLSLVVGGLVNYLGHIRLDNHVVNMARAETSHYTADFSAYLSSPSPQTLALFSRTIHTLIEKDNLIVVEFYNADSQKVTEAIKSSAVEIEKRLPKHGTEFTNTSVILCEKLTLGQEIFLRVFVPILDSAGGRSGYLEGIYHAPVDIVAQNQRETLHALILVVVVIFVITLALYPLIIRLNRKLLDYSHILALTNIGMLKVLGSAIAKRDSDTNIHNFRVALYAVRLGEKLHLSNTAMQGLIKGAFLHDVGKIAITDAILLKPGKLTSEEFEIMKTHVSHGRDILYSYDWLKDADEVVRYHHEKFNGSGYPAGLTGEDIPLNARIFAVVDVFDALTSRRPYKEPFSLETSVGIIREARGDHFDPAVADLFLEQAEEFYAEICNENEPLLHGKLEECIKIYFR